MSDADSTPKIVSAPIRMSPDLKAKVDLAVEMTGISQAEILRLALAIGLEDLRRVAYDLPALVSKEARPELKKPGNYRNLSLVPTARVAETDAQPGRAQWIDLRGGVAAGAPISAHVVIEPIPAGKEWPDDHYALKVFGASMEPKIPDGSTIVVKAWPPSKGAPRKGSIVVYSDSSGSTLKVLSYRKAKAADDPEAVNAMGDVAVLKSLNPAFPDVQTLEGGKIDAVFVVVL